MIAWGLSVAVAVAVFTVVARVGYWWIIGVEAAEHARTE